MDLRLFLSVGNAFKTVLKSTALCVCPFVLGVGFGFEIGFLRQGLNSGDKICRISHPNVL